MELFTLRRFCRNLSLKGFEEEERDFLRDVVSFCSHYLPLRLRLHVKPSSRIALSFSKNRTKIRSVVFEKIINYIIDLGTVLYNMLDSLFMIYYIHVNIFLPRTCLLLATPLGCLGLKRLGHRAQTRSSFLG